MFQYVKLCNFKYLPVCCKPAKTKSMVLTMFIAVSQQTSCYNEELFNRKQKQPKDFY